MSIYKGEKDLDELCFTILHTNDEHSALLPAPYVDYSPGKPGPTIGGIARLASLVNDIRLAKATENEPVLLISGGDFMGGSPFSWLAFRDFAAELSLMIELGYDVVTVGNHELDFNPLTLARYLSAAGYPEAAEKTTIVSSNMKAPLDHPLNQRGIEQIHIRELENGLKIGFFGLIGKDAITVSPLKESLEFTDQHEAAKAAIEELKSKDVDLIIAITHLGIKEDRALVNDVAGIDLIVGGHCHSATEEPIIEGETIIVQALELFKHLGVLELAFNPTTKKVRVRNSETGRPHLIEITDKVPVDLKINESLGYYSAHLGKLARELTGGLIEDISDVIAVSNFDLPACIGQESPMCNFITDAIRLTAQETLGKKVDFALFASGTIRASLNIGKMPYSKGHVNLYDLIDIVSLGSGLDDSPGFPLVSAYFTEKDVRKMIEISVFLTQYMSEHYFMVGSGIRASYNFKRGALNLPIINQLIPTTKGALSIDLFTGEGIQTGIDDSYLPLNRSGKKLYHVVFDYGVGTAIPLVGEKVFYLAIKPKDGNGNPIALDDAIIYREGKELKVWQAVVEYAAAQPKNEEGMPQIRQAYSSTTGRFTEA